MTEIKKPILETQSESCCSTESTVAVQTVRIAIDITKCNGCGLCGEVCPFGLPQKTSLDVYEITTPDSCTECSACQRNCPTQAIKLQEQQGCGCLWNARGQAKARKNSGSTNSCDNSSSDNCCG